MIRLPKVPLMSIITLGCLSSVGLGFLGIDRVSAVMTGRCLYVVAPEQVTVMQGETVSFNVTIESLTLFQSVSVVGTRLPCPCLRVSGVPVTLRPGENVTVKVEFDAADQPLRIVDAEIGLFLNVESAPVSIPLSFNICKKSDSD